MKKVAVTRTLTLSILLVFVCSDAALANAFGVSPVDLLLIGVPVAWALAAILSVVFCIIRAALRKSSVAPEQDQAWHKQARFPLFCVLLIPCIFFLADLASRPSGSAVAANIVSDLRSLKNGVLTYLEDTSADRGARFVSSADSLHLVLKYQESPASRKWERYTVYTLPERGWVGCDMRKETTETRTKLADRAPRVGLLGSPTPDLPPLTTQDVRWYTQEDGAVWMRAYPPEESGDTGASMSP